MSSSTLHIPDSEHTAGLSSKPHKVRKGTFSCWECKRRKIRCETKSSSSICASCQRHGVQCISQEFDEHGDSGYEAVEKRIDHVEGLVGQLVRQRESHAPTYHPIESQASNSCPGRLNSQHHNVPERACRKRRRLSSHRDAVVRSRSPSFLLAVSQDLLSRYLSLSGFLSSVLPSPNVAAEIMVRGKSPGLKMYGHTAGVDQLMQVPAIDHSPPAHPIFFARRLIQLAICLRYVDANAAEHHFELDLGEPASELARRYADSAHNVTSQDVLVNSVDGLEALMLEGLYRVHLGEMRSAWCIFRRALSIAQLIRMPGMATEAGQHMASVHYRLVYSDRSLSLALGLPCIETDDSFACDSVLAGKAPTDRLERLQVNIMGRIIARDIRMQQSRRQVASDEVCYDEQEETQEIDKLLKQAARSVPVSWWAIPGVHQRIPEVEAAEKFAQLIAQTHQSYLVLLLYQPYALTAVRTIPTRPSEHSYDPIYSKTAILPASRDVLSRFLLFRTFQYAPGSYGGLANKAFLAAATLLLSHIHGHALGTANVLEHQRPHDLKLIEDVVLCIQRISLPHLDSRDHHCVRLLRRLIEFEADAADGTEFVVDNSGSLHSGGNFEDDDNKVEWSYPYYGYVCVIRQSRHQAQPLNMDAGLVDLYTQD